MHIENALVNKNVKTVNPQIDATIYAQLENIPIEAIPHEKFIFITSKAKNAISIIEYNPYSNVILVSGVWGFGNYVLTETHNI